METQTLLTPTEALACDFVLPDPLRTPAAANDASAPRARLAGDEARQGFRIGSLCLMVRYEDGSELTELPALYRLPNTPSWFRGIANLHGLLIPVFDLAVLAGIDPQPGAKPMLLVLSRGADAAGVVIDGLPERLRWSAHDDGTEADVSMAPAAMAGCVRRAVLLDGHLWFDLDCDALLRSLEGSLGLNVSN